MIIVSPQLDAANAATVRDQETISELVDKTEELESQIEDHKELQKIQVGPALLLVFTLDFQETSFLKDI